MTWTGRPDMPTLHEATATDFDAIMDQIDVLTGYFDAMPRWRLSQSSTSVAAATDTRLEFTTNVSSSGVTVTSLRTITIVTAGRYRVRAGVRYTGGTAGRENYVAVRAMNSSNTAKEIVPQGSASSNTGTVSLLANGEIVLAAGDKLEAWTYQDGGSSRTPQDDPYVSVGGTIFEGRWVGVV